MRRIYVASALENAKTCRLIAERLRESGHQITSSWHDTDIDLRAKENSPLTDEQLEEIASTNHQDVMRANALVVLYDTRCRSTLFEVGAAFTAGHRIVIIGEKNKVPVMLAQRAIIFVQTNGEVEKYL